MKHKHIIEINPAACIGCGLCADDCPTRNLAIENGKARPVTQSCIMCGHCVAICPKAAVSITGFDAPPVDIEKPAMVDPQILHDALMTRRSIRKFTDKPVPPETIDRIIEAGRLTPTGGNAQNVSYIVLKERIESCERIAVRFFRRLRALAKPFSQTAKRAEIDDRFFFKGAPAAIMVVSPNKVDGALAASDMALMAEACGLGVLYSGFFTAVANASRALRKTLGLRRGEKVVTTLVVGYSAVKYRRTAQKEAAYVRIH